METISSGRQKEEPMSSYHEVNSAAYLLVLGFLSFHAVPGRENTEECT
jgi:hypothetical protein